MQKTSYREFLSHCKKKPPRIYYTWLYHQLAYPLSYVFFRLGLKPNTISIVSILLTIVAAGYIVTGSVLVGLALFFVSYIIDCCDGNVARMRFYLTNIRDPKDLKRGILLENLNTNVSNFLLFNSLGFYLTAVTGKLEFILLSLLTFGARILSRYTVMHVCALNASTEKQTTTEAKELKPLSLLHELKFFFVRVVDSARFYYVAYFIVFLFLSSYFALFFITYSTLIIILNTAKFFATYKRLTS